MGDVRQQAAGLEDLEVVEARVEDVQVVAGLQPVIVADPLNPVVVDVQPFKALWDGGKVEPEGCSSRR